MMIRLGRTKVFIRPKYKRIRRLKAIQIKIVREIDEQKP